MPLITTTKGVHSFDNSIFREYDIRGVAGRALRTDDAYVIARAFATKAATINPKGFICVGRDGRLSSPELRDAVCKGISETGLEAVDVGLGPTPMLYFACSLLKATGGIMVTGSHNPPDHNGFKFVLNGKAFYGEAIQELRTIGERGTFMTGRGKISARNEKETYIRTLAKAYRPGGRMLNVGWDAGNGATGDVMKELSVKLPGRHVLLNETIDGTFPAHHPDPTVPENLKQLIGEVRKRILDVGIAFDGDGDRIGVVDDEGEILWGDQLMMLYAAEVLKEKPGATIIADVKASGALFDEIKRLKGKPLMWKTGHSLIKSKMAETGAPLAGEMSGHIFFADRYYGYDDALYAAVRLLSLLAHSRMKLSELRKALPKRVNTPEIRFHCDDARKFTVIAEVKARLKKGKAKFDDIDGVRVARKDGWWLLRASNTQPMLVARAESATKAGLERLTEDLREQLEKSGVKLP